MPRTESSPRCGRKLTRCTASTKASCSSEGDGIFEHNIVRIEYQERNWGDPFPPLSLQILRTALKEKAAEDGIDADEVDPYRLFDL